MTEQWRRPTDNEAAQGYVAMLAYYYNSALPKSEWRWLGYTVKMMNRRVARGGGLPYWVTPKPATVADIDFKPPLDDLKWWFGEKAG